MEGVGDKEGGCLGGVRKSWPEPELIAMQRWGWGRRRPQESHCLLCCPAGSAPQLFLTHFYEATRSSGFTLRHCLYVCRRGAADLALVSRHTQAKSYFISIETCEHLSSGTELRVRLQLSPFSLRSRQRFVSAERCLCVVIQINLEVPD